jgi:hypothetical protein
MSVGTELTGVDSAAVELLAREGRHFMNAGFFWRS